MPWEADPPTTYSLAWLFWTTGFMEERIIRTTMPEMIRAMIRGRATESLKRSVPIKKRAAARTAKRPAVLGVETGRSPVIFPDWPFMAKRKFLPFHLVDSIQTGIRAYWVRPKDTSSRWAFVSTES